MGNADLRDLAVLEETGYEELTGSTVAVDASNWLYKYLTTVPKYNDSGTYTTSDGTELPNLIGVPRGLKRFFEYNLTPVFVFDGLAHDLKEEEIQSRREAKEQAEKLAEQAREDGNIIEAARYDARTKRLTTNVIESTQTLLDLYDVSYIEAPQAAESQAAHMAKEGDVQYAVSDDYDSMLFGSPRTVRNFTSSKRDNELINLQTTLNHHNLSLRQFVEIALLCGTDYNDGVHGIGTKTALKGMRKHGNVEGILAEKEKEVENLDVIRELFLDPNVTDDYDVPSTSPSPDVDSIRDYLQEKNINMKKVNRSLETVEESIQQKGLDSWM